MTTSKSDKPYVAPRAAILLPFAYGLHLVEEWIGGMPAWTLTVPVYDVSPERFIAINATAFVVVIVVTVAARLRPEAAWLATSLAALFALNAGLHAMATVGWDSYAPGVITGLLVYIPLSVVILRASHARMSRPAFFGSIVVGVLLHGLVAMVASG